MKLICVKTNKEIIIKNAKKPKMTSGYFGRSWDVLLQIIINDLTIDLYADTTWGRNCYFEYNNKWYSVPVWEVNTTANHTSKNKYILKRGS